MCQAETHIQFVYLTMLESVLLSDAGSRRVLFDERRDTRQRAGQPGPHAASRELCAAGRRRNTHHPSAAGARRTAQRQGRRRNQVKVVPV